MQKVAELRQYERAFGKYGAELQSTGLVSDRGKAASEISATRAEAERLYNELIARTLGVLEQAGTARGWTPRASTGTRSTHASGSSRHWRGLPLSPR